MKGLRLRRSITLYVWMLAASTAILVLILSAVLFHGLQTARKTSEEVRRSQVAVSELNALNLDLLNAETGQRGYLLTHDTAYLAPYLAIVARRNSYEQDLAALARQHLSGAPWPRMIALFNAKMDELKQTITEAEAGRYGAALAIVRSNRGKDLMDEFRRLEGAVIRTRREALRRQMDESQAAARFSLMILSAGGMVVVLLVLTMARLVTARVHRELGALSEAITAIAWGDLDRRALAVSDDELGQVANSVNVLAQRLAGAQAAQRDTLERLRLSMTELERSNRELDGFAYVASHDLRAPLRGIRNLVEWIRDDILGSASADTVENLRLLQGRVDRLDMLLDSLLQYSRVGRGGDPQEVDTAGLMAGMIDYLAPAPGFTIVCEGPMPVFRCRRAPLEQSLRNLIGNAIKHHDHASGRVEVSAVDLGDVVEFRIADDGPGIPERFHERVFQMFQTLKPRDQVEGSGMGLAIVKKAVETNGGAIRIESSPPRRGTVFIFTWAKSPPPGGGEAAVASASSRALG